MLNAQAGSTLGVVLPPPSTALSFFPALQDKINKSKNTKGKHATGLYPLKGHARLKIK